MLRKLSIDIKIHHTLKKKLVLIEWLGIYVIDSASFLELFHQEDKVSICSVSCNHRKQHSRMRERPMHFDMDNCGLNFPSLSWVNLINKRWRAKSEGFILHGMFSPLKKSFLKFQRWKHIKAKFLRRPVRPKPLPNVFFLFCK